MHAFLSPRFPRFIFAHLRPMLRSVAALVCSAILAAGADGPNLMPGGDFSATQPAYVPWAGVDGNNNIRGLDGHQMSVNDSGNLDRYFPFAPSVAVGNLSGSGKNDLILADARGYFWYFQNKGTPQVPAFTQGEVIPIWLGEEPLIGEGGRWEGVNNTVPRIQLVSFNNGPVLDLVAGVYSGKLFRIPNVGSASQPLFKPTQNRDQLLINTHRRGVLWCNYLAPFFTTAFSGGNVMDLLVGEGTYSANSIWLLRNTGNGDRPSFDEDHLKRLIPGMGFEQLAPCVVDWNNDGKPDVITGDRTGDILLYLNNSTDPENPTFAPGQPIIIGGQKQFGGNVTVTVGDLSNNHLPNLLIGRTDGTILYAVNSGTPGNPKFTSPAQPLKGVLPPQYQHYVAPRQWFRDGGWGAAYEMLGVVNSQTEQGFTMPDGVTAKNALKYWVWPYKNQYFQRFYMAEEGELNEHAIRYQPGLTLKMNTDYRLSFWVMSPNDTVSAFRFRFTDGPRANLWQPPYVIGDISSSSQWTQVTKDFRIDNSPDPTLKEYGYGFDFRFQGQATFYIADVELHEKEH